MELLQHGRYDYSPIVERQQYDWPGGKRLAFYIGLNVEHFHYGEGMGHTPTAPGPQPDIRNYAWRDYGLRVGAWRIFDLLDELKLPAAHLVNTTIYDYAPQIMARIRARGDEVIGHGRTNSERQGDLSAADEEVLIKEATEILKQQEGVQPGGWLGPWISETATTLDVLQENGYRYVLDWPIDDQPVWMKTRAGRILSVPYPVELNDSPAMLNRHHTAREFTDMVIDQVDVMLEQCDKQPLSYALSLHTFIFGQPYRLAQLRKIFEYIVDHPRAERIWFTRPRDVVEHIESLPAGTLPGDGT